MYDRNITLFVACTDSSREKWWFPYHLEGVDLNSDKAYVYKRYGNDAIDNAVMHVRLKDGKIGNFQYVTPKEYTASSEKQQIITIKGGKDADVIVLGSLPGFTESVKDSDYTKGFFQYLIDNYDHVYTVNSVSTPYSLIPHIEVGLK